MSTKTIATLVGGVIAAIVVVTLAPFTTIPTGHVGLVKEFNAYKGKDLNPGFHFLVPFRDNVVKMNVQTQAYEMSGVESYTKEGQVITLRGTVQYHVNPATAGKVYTDTGLDYENKLIKKFSEEEFKNAVSQFLAIEIPTNREKIASITESKVRARLAAYEIIVDDFAYGNEDYSSDYEEAIRKRQVQEQLALEAKNVTAQVEEKTKQEKLAADAMAYKTQKEVEALRIGGAEYVQKLNAEAGKIQAEAMLEFAKHPVTPTTLTVINGKDGVATPIPFLPLK